MDFTGIWINKDNNEQIKLTGPGDRYLLEYNYDGREYQSTEKNFPIYLSGGEDPAFVPHSKKFGRCYIQIIDENNIIINKDSYIKK